MVRDWHSSPERFQNLSAPEFVAVLRALRQNNHPDDQGETREHMLTSIGISQREDPWRATDLIGAFAASPFPDDRFEAANRCFKIIPFDHDTGLRLSHSLIGDKDKRVRQKAERSLMQLVAPATLARDADRGFYTIATLDEQDLHTITNLVRQEVYELYESYAYAENGSYLDLGQVALAKINLTPLPQDTRLAQVVHIQKNMEILSARLRSLSPQRIKLIKYIYKLGGYSHGDLGIALGIVASRVTQLLHTGDEQSGWRSDD